MDHSVETQTDQAYEDKFAMLRVRNSMLMQILDFGGPQVGYALLPEELD
jgi:hypothetical protein